MLEEELRRPNLGRVQRTVLTACLHGDDPLHAAEAQGIRRDSAERALEALVRLLFVAVRKKI
jgi:hypothetical protein